MGLSTALNSSLSGLRVTQSQLEVVSQNIANVDSVGYSRRKLNVVQNLSGSTTSGVKNAGIQRQLDVLVQKQLRTETSGASFTNVKARYAEQLDRLFGEPGKPGSLDSIVNSFASTLQTLTANPSDVTARAQVIANAQQLSGQLNGLTADIQTLRNNAETNISAGVTRVNELLQNIKGVDAKLFGEGVTNANSAGLLDERDRLVNELSGFIEVNVAPQSNGGINIFTNGGLQLYGPGTSVQLTFDARSGIDSNDLFTSNPATRGVGTIRIASATGTGADLIAGGIFRTGSIGAEIDIRDKVLVEAQTQLDDLAAGLAASLGDRNPTTSVVVGANAGFDVNLADVLVPANLALKAGNTLTISVNTPTGPRRFQVIGTDGPAPNPIPPSEAEGGATIIRYDRAGGIAGLGPAVAAALGPGFTATVIGSTLRILDAGGGNSVTDTRASFSTSGLTGEGPELQLFVDAAAGNVPYTGSLDGPNPQKRGFAGRIGVNGNLIADTSRLVVYNTTPGSVTPQGDSTRPRLLLDRLTNAQRSFSAGSGIGDTVNGVRTSVTQFARRVVEDQGANATQAQNVDDGQKLVLRSVEARFSESAGVSIDQELSELVQLQNSYAANARIISAVKDLFDTLLRIGA
jgi:flagellar hook-associated protein 1